MMKTKRVWCVMDRKAGHRSMTIGMAEALATAVPLEIVEVEPSPWVTPVGKALQSVWPLGAGWMRRGGLRAVPEGGGPDLVLGSGGNMLWATAALGRAWNCPSVFVGSRRRLPMRAMSVFVHHDPALEAEGFLRVAVLPGRKPPGDPQEAWREFCASGGLDPSGDYLACLVGGDGSGYTWGRDDGTRLGGALRNACERRGARLLVTTSRRTAAEVEAAIREELPGELVADACWFGEGDERRVVAPYLAGAGAVVVSEDSMSMVHEAVASRKPVATVRPARAAPPAIFEGYMGFAAKEGWLARADLGAPRALGESLERASGYDRDAWEDAGSALAQRLGWSR